MTHAHGPTHGCGCHPHHCGPPVRHCRQEPKELLVQPDKLGTASIEFRLNDLMAAELRPEAAATAAADVPVDAGRALGQAILGGGCCVQLSVEYMPATPSLKDQDCTVFIDVADSEGSHLTWTKRFEEGYHVKECIITTYPGARLRVLVVNAIARVRWCEVFSC